MNRVNNMSAGNVSFCIILMGLSILGEKDGETIW